MSDYRLLHFASDSIPSYMKERLFEKAEIWNGFPDNPSNPVHMNLNVNDYFFIKKIRDRDIRDPAIPHLKKRLRGYSSLSNY